MVEDVVENGKDDASIFQKTKVMIMAVTSLKDILDPTCPMQRRIVSSAKLTCCTSAMISFTLTEAAGMDKIPSHIKAKATMCCGASMLTLGRIQAIEANNNEVSFKTILVGKKK